jgi:hypothetical protein
VAFARRAPINGFPSLVVSTESGMQPVEIEFGDPEPMRRQIEEIGLQFGFTGPKPGFLKPN